MKRIHFSIALLLISYLNTFSQHEVFLDSTKSENIKVKSLHGLEVRFIPYPNGIFSSQYGYTEMKPLSLSIYAGYFNEKRLAAHWTLLSSIGLHNIALQSSVIKPVIDPAHGYYMSVGPDYKTTWALWLEAGIEPRWYWEYKSRNQSGEAQFNSGWFLSFPLLFQTTLMHTPEPLIHIGWFPEILYSGTLLFTPTMGYRQAISRQWFIEGTVGLGANIFIATNSIDHQFTVSNPELNPAIKFKAAYTFK